MPAEISKVSDEIQLNRPASRNHDPTASVVIPKDSGFRTGDEVTLYFSQGKFILIAPRIMQVDEELLKQCVKAVF